MARFQPLVVDGRKFHWDALVSDRQITYIRIFILTDQWVWKQEFDHVKPPSPKTPVALHSLWCQSRRKSSSGKSGRQKQPSHMDFVPEGWSVEGLEIVTVSRKPRATYHRSRRGETKTNKQKTKKKHTKKNPDNKPVVDELHWKDETESLSIGQTLDVLQRQHWEKRSQTGLSIHRVSQALKYHLVNRTGVRRTSMLIIDIFFFQFKWSIVRPRLFLGFVPAGNVWGTSGLHIFPDSSFSQCLHCPSVYWPRLFAPVCWMQNKLKKTPHSLDLVHWCLHDFSFLSSIPLKKKKKKSALYRTQ